MSTTETSYGFNASKYQEWLKVIVDAVPIITEKIALSRKRKKSQNGIRKKMSSLW